MDHNIVSNTTLDFYTQEKGEMDKFAFEKMLYLPMLDKMFESGKINFEEGKMVLKLLEE